MKHPMLFHVSLKHHVKQFASVLLWRHFVLLGFRDGSDKVTIITDNDIIILKENLCNGLLESC